MTNIKEYPINPGGMSDKVSIIIPCYKQAHFLPDAIESALAQTYTNIEVIVVNDGSPDNTSEVARSYGDNVILIEQENAGLSAARNTGIRNATGTYILPLDADDKIDPDFITKTIGIDDIVCTGLHTFGNEDRCWITDCERPEYQHFIQRNRINCCSLYKKSMWEAIGGYDEGMKMGFEDWDFWIRATRAGYTVSIVREWLFWYRKHSVSMFRDAQERRQQIIDYMMTKYAASEPIDVVYALSDDSQHDDMEMRYSLRSMERYTTGWRNIYIIGHLPHWLHNVNYIAHPDINAKAQNIMDKLIAACQDDRISENFLFINDDHFFNQQLDVSVYPYYHSDAAQSAILARPYYDTYREIVVNTMQLIPGAAYYDIHKPIIYNKTKFMQMVAATPYKEYDHGLLVKSSYCHHAGVDGIEMPDCVIGHECTTEEIKELIKDADVWSIHDYAINDDMLNYLEERYPVASRWEF
jgi:glycosyltransferase involved in cell wall biosynthesis